MKVRQKIQYITELKYAIPILQIWNPDTERWLSVPTVNTGIVNNMLGEKFLELPEKKHYLDEHKQKVSKFIEKKLKAKEFDDRQAFRMLTPTEFAIQSKGKIVNVKDGQRYYACPIFKMNTYESPFE